MPRAVEDWADAALARDREQRFANVTALWSALLSALRLRSSAGRKRDDIWAMTAGLVQRLTSGLAPSAASAEGTIELSEHDLERVSPPNAPPRTTPRVAEKTLSIASIDLIPEPAHGSPSP